MIVSNISNSQNVKISEQNAFDDIYKAVPSHEYTFYIKQEHVVAGLCVI